MPHIVSYCPRHRLLLCSLFDCREQLHWYCCAGLLLGEFTTPLTSHIAPIVHSSTDCSHRSTRTTPLTTPTAPLALLHSLLTSLHLHTYSTCTLLHSHYSTHTPPLALHSSTLRARTSAINSDSLILSDSKSVLIAPSSWSCRLSD